MRRVRSRPVAALLALHVCVTCGGDREASRRHAPARRVVSLAPSVSELIVALGGRSRLVGRTDYDTDSALSDLPSVGGASDPSIERLLALSPDLVILWDESDHGALAARLHDLGVRALTARTRTIGDVLATADTVGRLLGVESRAWAFRRRMTEELEAVRVVVAGRSRVSVLYVIWDSPLITVGAGTFPDELIRIAGGRNVFHDADQPWPTVSFEDVLWRSPDVIVWPRRHAERSRVRFPDVLRGSPGWRELDAVREGRVHVVDPDLFNRPGPRLSEAARALAAILHPEIAPSDRPTAGGIR